jgi:hypothetical protein
MVLNVLESYGKCVQKDTLELFSNQFEVLRIRKDISRFVRTIFDNDKPLKVLFEVVVHFMSPLKTLKQFPSIWVDPKS